MMNKMGYYFKHSVEYLIYLFIFVVLSKLSLTLFQKISIEATSDIDGANILAVVFVLFYLCVVLPGSLLVIKKIKREMGKLIGRE